ncbi:MAG TPA: hypothetical protein VMT00_10390 [Thermoanaerobaculia bacterium]|nr:hypothetical protein [Thermoanaerobaculia bacterium]
MLRSVIGILAGYLVFALAAVLIFAIPALEPFAPPPWPFLIASTILGICFSSLAGYVAAAIARRRPLLHSLAITIIIGAAALGTLIAQWGKVAVWSQLATATLVAPAALLGGWIRRRRAGLA